MSWRKVAAVRIDPVAATDCFIREALGDDRLRENALWLQANRSLRREVAALSRRLRNRLLVVPDDAWAAAYRRRLASVLGDAPLADLKTLRHLLRDRPTLDLRLDLADFVDPDLAFRARADFPEQIRVGDRLVDLVYRYDPGAEDDGVTLRLDERDLPRVEIWRLERAVPGLVRAWCHAALKQLPKDLRRRLIPLAENTAGVTAAVLGTETRLGTAFAAAVRDRCAVACPPVEDAILPSETRLRVEVRTARGDLIHAGRDLEALAGRTAVGGDDQLAPLRARWRTRPARTWPGELPVAVIAGSQTVHPALLRDRDAAAAVAVRRDLFVSVDAARGWHADGVAALLEADLEEDLAVAAGRADRDLASCEKYLGASAALLRRRLLVTALTDGLDAWSIRDGEAFAGLLITAREALPQMTREVEAILRACVAAVAGFDARGRRGVRGLGAAVDLSRLTTEVKRLFAGGWWERFAWGSLERLPTWAGGLVEVLDRGLAGQPTRRDRLLTCWEPVADIPIGRLRALDLREQHRHARHLLEEGLSSAATGRAVKGPAADLALRQAVAAIAARLDEEDALDRELRREALELRPYLERTTGPVGLARLRELDATLARFPDHGFASDPAEERSRLRELLARGRAAC